MTSNPKAADAVDRHVGGRIRSRRLMLGMSQERLAIALGLTFQQVQKYEKGTNRIGAGRLLQISRILDAPPAYFFDGAPDVHGAAASAAEAPTDDLRQLLENRGGLALARAYLSIEDARARRSVVDLLEHLATRPGSKRGGSES
ncbi:MAG: helix-turn-helix domain-containing protein [Microvirga sp.]